jgi:ribosome biogenesis GTPase / thiamine phosphate phosphatase
MSLEALGWNRQWREKFEACAVTGLVPARVVGEHRSHYRVATEATELSAGTTGRMRNTVAQRSDLPGVGDFVAVDLSEGDSPSTIEVVLPRTSALVRKAPGTSDPQLLAANVDVVFIVTALGGDFNLARMKRYLALVQQSDAAPVIVVNKSDLENDVVGSAGRIEGIGPDTPVHVISARVHESIRTLEHYLTGNRTVALIGSSGVGKSTLTNQLLGRDAQATQEVRGYDGRAVTRQRIANCSSARKAALSSTPPDCGGWNSGTLQMPMSRASMTSNSWPCTVGSAIASTRPSRIAPFDLPWREARSRRYVLRNT